MRPLFHDDKLANAVIDGLVGETALQAGYNDGRELGVWRDPEHRAARGLLDLGLANRGGMMRTFMSGAPASRGSITWFAATTAADPAKGSPHIAKWSPFERESEELAEAA
jgi:hypothetical protein